MKLYSRLSGLGFLKNHYARKILFVAFFGIHIPLIGAVIFYLYAGAKVTPIVLLGTVLGLTLAATLLTLVLLHRLVRPVATVSKAIEAYRNSRTVPNLPMDYTDEVGTLMANVQTTIKMNEALLQQKQDLAHLLSSDMKAFADVPSQAAARILSNSPAQSIAVEAQTILDSAKKQQDFLETYINILREEEALSKKVFKVRSVRPGEIIDAVKKQLAPKLAARKIHLETDIRIDHVHLRTEQDSLIFVVTNLVDNAIKYSPEGETVSVKVYRERTHLKISVSDNGIGFDGKNTDLFKLSNMTRSAAEGKSSGMSLYLSRQIVKKSDGQFYAESHGDGDRKGATFILDFKLYRRK